MSSPKEIVAIHTDTHVLVLRDGSRVRVHYSWLYDIGGVFDERVEQFARLAAMNARRKLAIELLCDGVPLEMELRLGPIARMPGR